MDFKGRPIPNFYDFVGGTLMENNNRDWPDIVDNTPLDIIMKEKTLSKWPDVSFKFNSHFLKINDLNYLNNI